MADRGGSYEVASQSNLIGKDQSFEKNLRSRGLIHQPEYERLTMGGVMRSLVTEREPTTSVAH